MSMASEGGNATQAPTTAPATAPATAPTETQAQEFSWDSWDGAEDKVPDSHKAALAAFKKHQQSQYDPVAQADAYLQRLRQGTQQQPQRQQQRPQPQHTTQQQPQQPNTFTKEQVEQIVQQRISGHTRQNKATAWEQSLKDFIKSPGVVSDGHDVVFSSDEQLNGYMDFVKELSSRAPTPTEIYILHNLKKILSDHSDFSIRKHSATQDKARTGPANLNPGGQQLPASGERQASSNVERNLTVAQIMKRDNPEAYEAIMAKHRNIPGT